MKKQSAKNKFRDLIKPEDLKEIAVARHFLKKLSDALRKKASETKK